MQHFDRAAGFALAALCAAALFGCSAPPSSLAKDAMAIVAPLGPPPMRAEIPPPAPAPDSLWLFGRWSWDGGRYVWMPGRYIQRPVPTANWVPGYWEQEPRGWVWTEGHWTS